MKKHGFSPHGHSLFTSTTNESAKNTATAKSANVHTRLLNESSLE